MVSVASHADISPHQGSEGVTDVGDIEPSFMAGGDGAAEGQRGQTLGLPLGVLSGVLAGNLALDEAFEEGIGA